MECYYKVSLVEVTVQEEAEDRIYTNIRFCYIYELCYINIFFGKNPLISLHQLHDSMHNKTCFFLYIYSLV